MIRKIIHIDEEKCNGCGLCVKACHEGALALVNGKARLTRDDYCDGFGDCLPNCPTGAITFTQREAAAYDEAAVQAHKAEAARRKSALRQWPTQLKLVPIMAPFFKGCHLLVAADCTAFAYANIHEDFMAGRVLVHGCPKLDGVDYAEKLTMILKNNDIQDVTVLRMTVPCCGGLANAVTRAIQASGKDIPCDIRIISTDGSLAE